MTVTAAAPKPSTVALAASAFGVTDPGKKRTTNEDQFLIAELSKSMRIWQTSLPEPELRIGEEHAHLFLVADGMGGARAGERASALAVAAIEQFTLNTFKWFFGADRAEAERALRAFETALRQADAHILNEVADHPELSGMGTTVTMAFHIGARLCLVHVGDSRAYLYRRGDLNQLTEDHTVVADMVRDGTIREDEARRHPLRHVITNVVGGHDAGVKVEARAVDLEADDRLLLCSDGLTEMMKHEDIEAVLAAEREPEAAARALVAQANDSGGRDNITVVIVRFDPVRIEPTICRGPIVR
jgi:PPM family protein phosphatase